MGLFTPDELEAMRRADEEIDREFTDRYVASQVDLEIDKWLDGLAVQDTLDHRANQSRKRSREYSAAYYAEHKEKIAAYMAAYYAEHKEEIAVKKAAYRAEHKEEIAAYMAAYYAEHKEEIAVKKAAYRAEHKEEIAAYMREYQRNRRNKARDTAKKIEKE